MDEKIIKKVELDLKRYPDWVVRLEASGLGIAPRGKYPLGGCGYSFSSIVESEADLNDEIERKVFIIEKVYDRLRDNLKRLIEMRYYREYTVDEIIKELNLPSKRRFYFMRDRALESFARALSYID